MPRLNGKFVSQEKYDAAMASEQEKAEVSDETTEAAESKPRNLSPLTVAQRRFSKARRALDVAQKRADKVTRVEEELAAAQAEYDEASAQLQDIINS